MVRRVRRAPRTHTSRRLTAPVLAVTAVLVAATGACSSSGDAGPSEPSPGPAGTAVEVSVTPETSGMAEPVAFTVTGLEPDVEVTLRVTSTDDLGTDWESTDTYRADGTGTVDLDAQARAGGGAFDPMVPIASMHPADPASDALIYAWSEDPRPFTVTALVDGDEVGTAEIQRGADRGVLEAETSVVEDGFVGRLWMPPDGVDVRSPALVALGGSEGGLSTFLYGWALAGEGHPVLEVAYFDGDGPDLPGLPADLADIPLEYVVQAVQWLGRRPDIDPDRIWTIGASRGSEAALLVGADFPDLVSGVIGASPSDLSRCGLPDCDGPAWTLGGAPVPFVRGVGVDAAAGPATIPVQQIDGPVLTVCGGRDATWDSCAFSSAIDERLEEAAGPHRHEVIAEPDAGHLIDLLVPYQPRPLVPGAPPRQDAEDQAALARVWPQVLDFLDASP